MQEKTGGYQPATRVTTPPQRRGPKFNVIRLKGAQLLQCTIFSHALAGFEVHWDDSVRRTEPHISDVSNCPGCASKLPRKRLYYLHIWSGGHGVDFIELPEEAAVEFLETVNHAEDLRGLRVMFKRTQANNGRVHTELLEWQKALSNEAPAAIDPEPILQELWNARRRK